MTDRGNRHNVLKQIAWFKNGRLLRSVKNPDPKDPEEALGPLVIEKAVAKDGGNYTCVINVVLRAVLEYNVSDITPVSGMSYDKESCVILSNKYNKNYPLYREQTA